MRRVLVFGVFDGIHEGHLAFLRQARNYAESYAELRERIPAKNTRMYSSDPKTRRGADAKEEVRLIVALARDEVVRKLKEKKPRKDLRLRIKEVGDSGLADEVVEGDAESDSWEVIRKYKPDIIALGYDQERLGEALRKYLREKELQIEVRVMKPHDPDQFHSSILNK